MATVLENRLEAPALAEFGTPSWGDYGSTIFNVGGAEAAAFAPAIVRWGAQSLPDSELTNTIADSAKYLQDALHAYSEGSFDQLSPAMKERLTADILTSDEFWQHPLSVMTAQTARTLPTMAATGLSMLFSGGGLGALATAAAVGGVQGMGQSIDAMQRDVDTRSDTELKQFNPVYSQLRADGISEATARKQIQQAMIGAKPMAIFALSAVTNAFGPETQVLRALGMKGLGKVAEGGIARRVGKEFGQGALSEGIEESGQQAFQEQAAVDAGFQPAVSLGNIAQSGLSAAMIGGLLGAPAGIRRSEPRSVPPSHDTTTAGERAHPDNPPNGFRRPDTTNFPRSSDIAGIDPFTGGPTPPPPPPPPGGFRRPDTTNAPLPSDIAGIDPFTGGPVSMPPRGGDTQGSPPIAGSTPPPVPGGRPPRRSSKKGVVPTTPTTENAPTVTGEARIVIDDAQALAVEATKSPADQAFKNAIAAQNTRAAQADQAFKNAQVLPSIVTPPSPGAGTMPAPGPAANVAPATPTEDMGAGTTSDEQYGPPRLPPVTAEYEQTQDYPRQPRTADGRRVLDTVPDQATLGLIDTRNEQLAARNARLPETTTVDTTPAPVAGKALPKGKDTKRNAKTAADDAKAQTLLGERPREITVSSVPEFRKALQNIIGKAGKLSIDIKTKVGYDTTPDSLVWLAEAKALFKKLNLKGISTQDKTDAINTFLDGEQQLIHKGHAEAFRSERAQEGAAQKQGVYAADENEADTSVGPAAPVKAVGVRGTNRPGLGIESYSEEHNLPQKEGGEERDTRQQAVQRDVSKLSPSERAALIAERGKPPTEQAPKAGPKTKKALSAAQKNKQQRAADKQAADLEKAKAVAKGLPKEQAEAARKAAAAQEAARVKEAKAKEAADTETAIKQLMNEKKISKKAATAIVKGHAKERQQKAEATAKAAQAREEAERTFIGPQQPHSAKAIEAIQTAERVKARKQAEKQARSEAAAAKRTPFSVLKALTRKAQEARARAFKPVVRTKLEIARSLAKKITGFVTAKGSTYTVDAEGKTTRTKAARKDIGHEGDEGLKTKSEKTVYVSKRNASALAQPQGANWRFVDHGDGTFSLITKNRDGQWGVSPDQHKISVTTEPEVGSIPLELWKGETIKGLPAYGRAHFGNQIVSVTKGRPTLTLPTKLRSLQALSSPQVKERLFGKKKLQAEKKKVEEAHSDAKHEADNFTKGHVSIEGVPVSIETKAGFGSIPGTVDTNGKPVKVLLGEEAIPGNKNVRDLQVAVIDQVDPSTGALTNHVVLYGFDDIQAAVNEFDGNFPDQMGDFAVMSHDELQAWIKSKDNAEAVGVPDLLASGVSEEDVAALAREMGVSATPLERQEANSEHYRLTAERNAVAIKTVDQAFEEIRSIHINNSSMFPKAQRLAYRLFAKRIRRLARNVKIYVVPDDIFEAELPAPQFAAYYIPYGENGHIVLRESNFRNPAAYAQFVLHEATHAAFIKAVHSNPALAAQLKVILQAAENAYRVWLSQRPMYSEAVSGRPYGFTNTDEMLAELTSRPSFMMWMGETQADPVLLAHLGINTSKIRTWWDWAVDTIGQLLGLPNASRSFLGATLKVMERLEYQAENVNSFPMSGEMSYRYMRQLRETRSPSIVSPSLLSRVTENLPERFRPAPGQEQMSNPRLLWIRSLDGLAQMSKMFGRPFYERVRAIADTLGRIDASAKEYLKKWLTTIDESLQLEREYKRTEAGTIHWNNLQNVMHDERSAGAWAHLPLADQPGTVKDPLRGAYARARMPDLYARWSALPDDLKVLRMKTLNFYAARQNEANERNLKNIMRAAGFTDPALMHRIFNGTETEADKALLGPVYDHITDNEQVTRIKGPYYPFKRRGDHVVRALYKITAPRRFLREIPNEDGSVNTWEFGGPGLTTEDAQKMAADYAATQTDLYPTVTSLWVNEATGENTYTDASGEEQRVSATDPDSVKRFRVSVENRYVEFFDKKEALRVAKDLENHPDVIPDSVKEVVEQRFIPQDRQMDLASYKMQALADTIKKRASFKNLPPHEQAEVEGVLMEASLRILPHTRIQTRHLPFNHIQGASKDSTRAMMEHAESLSGFMSRLDHQQDLNEAIAGMMKETEGNDGKSLSRSHVANHVLQRINNAAANPPSSFMDGVVKRILITSFLARLVSPATSMVNMMQPITTTLPMLASRHGPGRSSREMLRVYKQIGTGRSLKTGIAATGRALRYGAGAEHPTLIEDMMVGMSANQRRMVKELIARNIIDPDVGIEVSLLNERASIGGFLDRMLNYLQRFGRQMPRTIEAINRVVTATAAYNLELEKSGGNHDIAVNFAAEITSATQGVYSRTNAAPIFNHPLGKISFQFKQYAQLIYELIGSQVEKAYRNAEPGDRAEALKALGFMAISYTTIAGTMGLPTEPIKLLLMAAAPLGLPFKWEDFENDEREFMASIFGKYIGEIITHGISRALPEGFAFDLSSRVGIQDLLLFGEPRSQDEQDVKAYLWDVVAGAPGALVRDWFQGTQDLLSGDVLNAAQKLNPVKVGADLVKSYRMATEGKKTGAGYQSLSPYSLGEAAIRTFGFTPARESEAGEASRYFYAKQAEAQGARGSFMHQWAAASGSERGKLWGQIERYNSSREDDEKLTRADLDRYVRSRATIEKSRRSGLRLTRREKSLYKDITGVYNIQ